LDSAIVRIGTEEHAAGEALTSRIRTRDGVATAAPTAKEFSSLLVPLTRIALKPRKNTFGGGVEKYKTVP
jgi:hypothetical protein